MSALRVIAIDGAAGSGKSTLARGLALALGVACVSTGLMYRALTSAALEAGVDTDDGEALADLLRGMRFTLSDGSPPELEVEGSIPEDELKSDRVEASVSQVARHPQVRALMRSAQRELGMPDAVVEGRDIGTVVFPDAPVKLFLTAAPDARGVRRAEERRGADLRVASALRERDALDAAVNPFQPAPGAIVLDTSHLTAEQTLQAAIAAIGERLPEALS